MRGAPMRLVALAVADAVGVVALRPDLALLAELRAPHAWIGRAGVDAAAAEFAGAALWLAACWLAVGLLAAAIAAVPGSCGRAGARLAARLLPGTVYRLVAGAAGLGIALAPVPAGAAAPPPATSSPTSPAWPTSAAPAPMWPTAPHAEPDAPHHHRQHPGTRPASADHVVVAPGDSLWSIAAAHLDHPAAARVAASWPRWYAVNRAVIGADPDHIVAGQVLEIPAHHPEEGTS
jgi:resuscitation-promoting factor RpfA